MKRENNMSSMFIHFPNASILRSAILGAVTIPGAYPGQANRTRLIVPGSFPVDVTLSLEEVLVCWRIRVNPAITLHAASFTVARRALS